MSWSVPSVPSPHDRNAAGSDPLYVRAEEAFGGKPE
jgi:hypothetical protein